MSSAAQQALEMLDAFASVGAQQFDMTFTDAAGSKVGFYACRSAAHLRPTMDDIFSGSADRKHNVIVRPRAARATLIQLDDLGEDAVERLQPVSFLVVRTSPGNYQAWVAVVDGDAEFARRLRKGAGADLNASGATRISGSLNFKEKYAPNYPRIETVFADPGKLVTQSDLEALGFVAPREPAGPVTARIARRRQGARGWPNYQRCVDNAPQARAGGRPDISRADFTFCLLAIDWGWSVEEAAARLLQESGKAQEEGAAYATRIGAAERRGGDRAKKGSATLILDPHAARMKKPACSSLTVAQSVKESCQPVC